MLPQRMRRILWVGALKLHPALGRAISLNHKLLLRKSANIGLSETAVLDIMAANLQQQRAINEQLRREADIPRISVSEACTLMIKYMSDHENEDCLLSGFTSQKVNPFREKSTCSIL